MTTTTAELVTITDRLDLDGRLWRASLLWGTLDGRGFVSHSDDHLAVVTYADECPWRSTQDARAAILESAPHDTKASDARGRYLRGEAKP